MHISELPIVSFRSIGRRLGLVVEMWDNRLVVYAPIWRKALSAKSQFCRAAVAAGYLTERQMRRAVWQYRLGISKQGGVIFWQIDQHDSIYDGKVMYYREDCHRDKQRNPTWVSHLLSVRHGWGRLDSSHCFFGLHLLGHTDLTDRSGVLCHTDLTDLTEQGDDLCHTDPTDLTDTESEAKAAKEPKAQKSVRSVRSVCDNKSVRSVRSVCEKKSVCDTKTICVVEAEKSAVILSARYPEYVWLAAGGLGEVQTDKFRALRGRKVVMFPDTDPDGIAYRRWYEAAQLVMQQPFWEDSPPIYVSPLLEQQATAEQKQRKIDLVDFLFEQRTGTD
jgi:hypothetical protein